MKNYFLQIVLCIAILSIGFIHGCSKNSDTPQLTLAFEEEFKNVYAITHSSEGWILKNFAADGSSNFDYSEWQQGQQGTDKFGNPYGFPAYSYSNNTNEYAFSGDCRSSYSSWLITPVLSVKNGDKISFYTRADDQNLINHMQVLMNGSASTEVGNSFKSVGDFTTVLFDINPNLEYSKYPKTWTKYEYTFSNIIGKIDTRIAFRHNLINPADPYGDASVGIGIDVFKLEVK